MGYGMEVGEPAEKDVRMPYGEEKRQVRDDEERESWKETGFPDHRKVVPQGFHCQKQVQGFPG